MQDVERTARRCIEAGLAPPAQFVEADRRERPDQREAGGNREGERQHRIAGNERDQAQSDERIEHAEEQGVARHSRKIVEAARQRLQYVARSYASDFEMGRRVGTDEKM